MQKNLTLLFLAISLLFAQCKKNNVDTTSVEIPASASITPQITEVINSLKQLPTADLRRLAYNSLSSAEKYAAWVDNAQEVSVNFNAQQKALTTEFIQFISPQLFVSRDYFKISVFRDTWLGKAEKVFSDAQIRALAFNLYSKPDVVVINTTGLKINTEGGTVNCDCNMGSEFTCSSKTHCPNTSSTCKLVGGCGFAGFFSCDNICAPGGAD